MKKFTQIDNKNIENSTTKNDFLKNLIDETLSVENENIKGKDTLYESIKKIIEINDHKTIINVLENVKVNSYKQLNLQWINDVIENEKIIIEGIISTPAIIEDEINVEPEHITMINENIEEIKEEVTEETTDDIIEKDDNIITKFYETHTFTSNNNFNKELDDLNKLIESIKLNEEHHLITREEKIQYILDNLEEKNELITNYLSLKPTYIKDADIEETLNELSDKEVDELYQEIEK
jgi:hypothetical protein